jgi:hypothetical protein
MSGADSLGGAEEAGLLELEVVELLLAVHLDDEGHHKDEEGGAGDPRGLAGAADQLLRHEGRVQGRALRLVDDRRLRHAARDPRD